MNLNILYYEVFTYFVKIQIFSTWTYSCVFRKYK